MKNLLIITYWSYKDALIQAYTLPYVKLIRKNLEDHQKIYLVTLEQESNEMTKREWTSEKEKFSVYYFMKKKLIAIETINDQKTFVYGKKLIRLGYEIPIEVIRNKESNIKEWLTNIDKN